MIKNSQPAIIDARTAQKLIGLLGLALPVILVIGHFATSGAILPTLSEYVYTEFEPFFVGILFAIGVMFFAYKGYADNKGPIPLSDNNLANIAGAASIMTAIAQTRSCLYPAADGLMGIVHVISAIVMLNCMALFCLFYFTQTGTDPVSAAKERKNKIYRICGYIMVAGLLIGLIYMFVRDQSCPNPSSLLLWLEWMMIWAFSFAWCIKGGMFLKD